VVAKRDWFLALVALVIFMLSVPAFAGGNTGCKIAVHVKAHPTSCAKGYPVFRNCLDINTTYPGLGDIDLMPVVYDLFEYTAVEFGLQFDDGCTMSWVRCKGDFEVGRIGTESPSGTAIYWLTCQRTWAVAPGYGWCYASKPGLVCPVPNPATDRVGTLDCGASPGPYYDQVMFAGCAGIGGPFGDYPCGRLQAGPSTWGSIKALFQ